MADAALSLILWGSGVILVLAVAAVGALAEAERPRRSSRIADILRKPETARKDLP